MQKYKWSLDDLPLFDDALKNPDSLVFLNDFFDRVASLESCEDVANAFYRYVSHCASQVFDKTEIKPPPEPKENAWFDDRCVELRNQALANPHDNAVLRKYNAYKQSSKRRFGRKNAESLQAALGSSHIWSIMKKLKPGSNIEPDRDLLFDHVSSAVQKLSADYFNYDLEKFAVSFLKDYDSGVVIPDHDRIMHSILNDNITLEEVLYVIRLLKAGKCPELISFQPNS